MENKYQLRHAISLQLFWFLLNGLIILSQQFTFSLKDITDLFHFLYFMSGRLIMIPIILYFATILEERSFAQLGLTKKDLATNIRTGIRLNLPLLAMVLLFINLPLSSGASKALSFHPLFTIHDPSDLGQSLLYLLPLSFVAFLPALAEELLYRGILWPIFRKYFGIYVGILFNAAYYAFIFFEFQIEIFLLKFCVGLICAILYHQSGSLAAPVTFQALYHAIFILYIFGFSYW